jgi:hypothetical protein
MAASLGGHTGNNIAQVMFIERAEQKPRAEFGGENENGAVRF